MLINYVLGRYQNGQKDNAVYTYTLRNAIVHYGDEKEAYEQAKKISIKENKQYYVFRLIDCGTYYDDDPC